MNYIRHKSESSCKRFLAILQKPSEKEISSLIHLALKYPPTINIIMCHKKDKKVYICPI